jgi:DNA-binding transcriptional LysR family regulator
MQIELIETFLDLCETRSFHRTADRLGVTQSTVSGRIRALERATGRRLFTRGRAGTELTTEGLMFAPHARNLRLGWAEACQRHAAGGGFGADAAHRAPERPRREPHRGLGERAQGRLSGRILLRRARLFGEHVR